ncbi:MAG: sensor histidine kinase [Burkholderiaceae bacterium]
MSESAPPFPPPSPADESIAALQVRQLHHSVRNSLQLISATLQLQSRQSAHDEVKLALRQAIDRLGGFARIHRRLQDLPVGGQADGLDYLTQLLDDLQRALVPHGDPRRIRLVDPQPFALSATAAMAFGSIVNELVTNAIKYGAGDVRVSARPDGEALVIGVENPLPAAEPSAGMRAAESSAESPAESPTETPAGPAAGGFGLHLVRSLCGPRDGRLDVERTDRAMRVTARLDTGQASDRG